MLGPFNPNPSDNDQEKWFKEKMALLERALGPAHDKVLHYIVADPKFGPYHSHLFYRGLPGTGFATMQLARIGGDGPSNGVYRAFELLAFTRSIAGRSDNLEDVSGRSPAGLMRAAINEIGAYAFQARLDPFNTLEFPRDYDEYVGGRCFVIAAFKPELFDESFGLMTVIEIHRDELAFAQQTRGLDLVEKLQASGAFPYCDIDRPSVISGKRN